MEGAFERMSFIIFEVLIYVNLRIFTLENFIFAPRLFSTSLRDTSSVYFWSKRYHIEEKLGVKL